MHVDRDSARLPTQIPATMTVDDNSPIKLVLVDLSRGGCRVQYLPALPVARAIVIRVAGWPPITGRTVWSRDGHTGCIFHPKLDEADFGRLLETIGIR